MPHVHGVRQARPESAAVVDEARQRHAAEADAVIGALARHEHRARSLPARAMIGHRDLHRGIDGFRTGVAEEHLVDALGRQPRHALGGLEGFGVRALEARHEIQFDELLVDGLGNVLAAVADRRGEQARTAVEHRAAVGRVVVNALGA
jgi:hypothetical protein